MDSEAVLFVHHYQSQRTVPDAFLEQGVRPDGKLRIAAGKLGLEYPALGARHAAGQPGQRTPSGASQSESVRMCCSASNSVGAMIAACRPD